MAARRTRILPVHCLSKAPANQDIAEWWIAERGRGTFEAAAVAEAASALRTSDVPVAFPTETVYGLGADATRSAAVRGIYNAKQRPADNPLIVHVDSLEMIQRLLNPQQANDSEASTTEKNVIPSIYKPLILRFWPGPLTILLPNPPNSLLAKEVTSNLTTFGVRMPSSPFARLLIHVTGRPLAAPSANASTKPSPTTAMHVYHDLQGRIDLILDGGPCGVGVESTIVDGLSNPPSILRPGGIGIEELRTCQGWESVKIGYRDGLLPFKEVPRAPGMKYRHYSPKARVVLFEANSNIHSVSKRVREDLKTATVGTQCVGILRTRYWPAGLDLIPGGQLAKPTNEDSSFLRTQATSQETFNTRPILFEVPMTDEDTSTIQIGQVYDVLLGRDADSIARGLFSSLRTLDALNVDVIYVEGISDGDGDLAAAVMNRLRKAAEIEVKI